MKVVFMGTPDFSVPSLEALHHAGHEVVAVYTQPPRKAGRGHKVQKSAVHIAAEKLGIPVFYPITLKTVEAQNEFASHKADIAVVVAYGLLLPKSILEICRCLNIHASLLPRWRGAAPIHRAIQAGDARTGICIMEMDEGLDTGDVLLTKECAIEGQMTTGILHDQLKIMGAEMIVEALALVEKGVESLTPQKGDVSYAHKITKQEAEIDWNDSIKVIDCQIRAFNPYPGAFFAYKDEKIKILEAECKQCTPSRGVGEVDMADFSISASDGIVYPKIVQRPGKRAMSVEEMLRGYNH